MTALAALASAAGGLVWVAWAWGRGGATSRWVLAATIAAFAVMLVTGSIRESDRGASAERDRSRRRAALALCGVTLAVSALLPINHSRDLYLYDMYGRTVLTHHENPYDEAPGEFDDDPVLDMVRPQWHDHPAMYGPTFVVTATVLSALGGTNELTIRLVWQLATAAAAFAALVLVARRTRSTVAVLALGLCPVTLAAVNDAHNDVLVGLLLLVAVLLASERMTPAQRGAAVAAGLAAGVALGIKVIVAVPLAALAWWLLRRRGTRDALAFSIGAGVTAALMHLPLLGTSFLTTLGENSGDGSRFSIWRPWRDGRFEELIGDRTLSPDALEATYALVNSEQSRLAMAVLVPTLAWVLWRFRNSDSVAETVTAAGLAVLLCSGYVMPWYAPMLLPVAVLALRSRATTLLWFQSLFLLFAYADGAGVEPSTWLGTWLDEYGGYVTAMQLAALWVWVRPTVTSTRKLDVHARELVDT